MHSYYQQQASDNSSSQTNEWQISDQRKAKLKAQSSLATARGQ